MRATRAWEEKIRLQPGQTLRLRPGIALIVTPDGLPLAYEVLAGNTSDKTTLAEFLKSIEDQYGQANRTWVMDRGIPTEETLQIMRDGSQPIHYLVGTPRGRLTRLEKSFLAKPWQQVRDEVNVKLLKLEGELYVMARSDGSVDKERAMRRRRLKKFWHRLKELQTQKNIRDNLLQKDGRRLILPRYTQPDPDQKLLLHQLDLILPQQPPPRISAETVAGRAARM